MSKGPLASDGRFCSSDLFVGTLICISLDYLGTNRLISMCETSVCLVALASTGVEDSIQMYDKNFIVDQQHAYKHKTI